MINPNKILCIGAGHNIQSVIHFSETKEFVFIDSQPRIKNEMLYLETNFDKKKYVFNFVNDLLLTCLYKRDAVIEKVTQCRKYLNPKYMEEIQESKFKKWVDIYNFE
jgi:hypothetical protein